MTSKDLKKSPQRFTFQKNQYLERTNEEDIRPEYLDFLDNAKLEKDKIEADLKWRENNLEYDLRSTDWICKKVKDSEVYAQNLYAALCNNDFQKLEVIPILKEETWGCSWRYAGGIIADMREEGDYIDWYCSGIGYHNEQFVGEGVVTDEVLDDIKTLGWILIEISD